VIQNFQPARRIFLGFAIRQHMHRKGSRPGLPHGALQGFSVQRPHHVIADDSHRATGQVRLQPLPTVARFQGVTDNDRITSPAQGNGDKAFGHGCFHAGSREGWPLPEAQSRFGQAGNGSAVML